MFPLNKARAAWVAGVALGAVALPTALRRRVEPPPGPVTLTTTPVEAAAAPVTTSASSAAPSAPVFVHVAGEVKTPGLYRLPCGARVMDGITSAGGATANADLDALNLATPLRDGQKLVVPKVGAATGDTSSYVTDSPAAPELVRADPPMPPPDTAAAISAATPPASMPETMAPGMALPSTEAPSEPPATPFASSGGKSHGSHSSKLKTPGEGTVNINTAGAGEMERLPGVGPSTAAKILDYRASHGGFKTVEELTEVKGIGPKKLEKMRPFVVLQ